MSERPWNTMSDRRKKRTAVALVCLGSISLAVWEYQPEIIVLVRGGYRAAATECHSDTGVYAWVRRDSHPVYRRVMTVIVRRGWRRWATPEEPVFEREPLRLCESYVWTPEQGRQTLELTVMADTLPLCRIDFLTGEIHGHMYDGYTIRATALRAAGVGGRAFGTALNTPVHRVMAEAMVR